MITFLTPLLRSRLHLHPLGAVRATLRQQRGTQGANQTSRAGSPACCLLRSSAHVCLYFPVVIAGVRGDDKYGSLLELSSSSMLSMLQFRWVWILRFEQSSPGGCPYGFRQADGAGWGW
ncbi:hypothetical protein, partial [Streptomyces olivochromogenes]|uniref:hypothetical protein n=1 Tax=Streptomyces olivochromogenes TaxID=1963 RepID=UPI001F42B197